MQISREQTYPHKFSFFLKDIRQIIAFLLVQVPRKDLGLFRICQQEKEAEHRAGFVCAGLFICNDTENLDFFEQRRNPIISSSQSFSLGPSLSQYLLLGPKQIQFFLSPSVSISLLFQLKCPASIQASNKNVSNPFYLQQRDSFCLCFQQENVLNVCCNYLK